MMPKEVKLFAPKLPYLQRLTRKHDFILQTLVETIKKVIVHIPLLTTLKSNPKHGRIIKDLMAHTDFVEDINSMEKVVVGGHCAMIIEGKLPSKMKVT